MGVTASDALAFGFQEGLCSGAGSERGSVATGGDGAVQLTSYRAMGAAAPGGEDPPVRGVSTISHPRPAPLRPPRAPQGTGAEPPVPAGREVGGSALISTAAAEGPAWRNEGKHHSHPQRAAAR